MNQLNLYDVTKYVETHIDVFHTKRLDSLEKLKLNKILKRKNPYLFKAKNVLTSQEMIEYLLSAYISSQEETIFGEFLERFAIFICENVYGGHKSAAEGIDLEFEKDGIKYIVSIKSGPNWGNSGQIKKMKDNFKKAKKILNTNTSDMNVVAINGCCYGNNNKDDGDYIKKCGQDFWEFISGHENLYTDIIEPLGTKAKEKNDAYISMYSKIVNKFTLEFGNEFCDDGYINWKKLVEFNSSK